MVKMSCGSILNKFIDTMVIKKDSYWIKRHPIITVIIGAILFFSIIGAFSSKNETEVSILTSSNSATDFCRTLIPDRINVEYWKNENNEEIWSWKNNETPMFNDGVSIPIPSLWFQKGWREGENVNYLYSSSYSAYEKQQISSDGTIGKEVSYRILFILDPNDNNSDGYKIKYFKCCKNEVGVSYCSPQNAQLQSR